MEIPRVIWTRDPPRPSKQSRPGPVDAISICVAPRCMARRVQITTAVNTPKGIAMILIQRTSSSVDEPSVMIFADRTDAGRRLAAELSWLLPQHPIVVALPRGGVPVAVEVAAALDAPLELLSVRTIGAPQTPEFAVGAMAEDGVAIVDSGTVAALGLTDADIERVVERESRELRRRVERYRGGEPPTGVRGRTVVVVDDGLATGLTVLAAVRTLRGRGAARIIVAVPVGSPQAAAMLREEADEVVCLEVPDDLGGVGRWYRDFAQVSDEEVLSLLGRTGAPPHSAGAPSTPGLATTNPLTLRVDDVVLGGDLAVPPEPLSLIHI